MSESTQPTAARTATHRHFYAVKKVAIGFKELRRAIPDSDHQFQRDIDDFAKSFHDLIELRYPELAPLIA